jgi:tetratricopeptide (TPR) repeat protein
MAEKKQVPEGEKGELIVAQAKDFWTRNSKIILGVGTVLLLLVGGFFVYKTYFKGPKEEKASEAMFKAEEYFRQDSVRLALNGDGQNLGFLRIIDLYSGTKAANLSSFYAGVCYLRLDDNQNAVKHLEKFSSGAKQVQQRAYKLLGDAYGDLGNHKEALDYYKKAARHFEEDINNASEALFNAAYLADRVLKNQEEAISLYKEIKQKYPQTQYGYEADKYLAQLGIYNVN